MADEEVKKRAEVIRKMKIGLFVLLGVVVVIFLLSNLAKVKVGFLFGLLEMEAPMSFFIFLFLIVGAIVGFVGCLVWIRIKSRDPEPDEEKSIPVDEKEAEDPADETKE